MSYKIRNGKLVRRTATEQVTLDRRKAASIAKEEAAEGLKKGPFAQVTNPQIDKLRRLRSHKCDILFLWMAYQSYRHKGQPFVMLTEQWVKDGFSLRTQGWAIDRMEQVGLISVNRRPPKPPAITVV